jgi:hypothetical protein
LQITTVLLLIELKENMAQGKTKIKGKLPENSKHKSNKTNKKNSAFQKRKRKINSNFSRNMLELTKLTLVLFLSGAPVQKKMVGKLRIQDAITKTVNKKNEDEMRSRAISSNQKMSSAQNAVKKHHEKKAEAAESESMATEET